MYLHMSTNHAPARRVLAEFVPTDSDGERDPHVRISLDQEFPGGSLYLSLDVLEARSLAEQLLAAVRAWDAS